MRRILAVASVAVLSSACSAATWGAGLQSFADGYGQGAAAQPSAMVGPKLMLFGGPNHKTYLGCLNCNKFAPDSVENTYGVHGSRYAAESIFNRYSEFGSKYSAYSACNRYATDPPIIVDESGSAYGRLTVNTVNMERTTDPSLRAWLGAVCSGTEP